MEKQMETDLEFENQMELSNRIMHYQECVDMHTNGDVSDALREWRGLSSHGSHRIDVAFEAGYRAAVRRIEKEIISSEILQTYHTNES